MATQRIRNFHRMKEFLEEKQLYIPGMSYAAMEKAEADFLGTSRNLRIPKKKSLDKKLCENCNKLEVADRLFKAENSLKIITMQHRIETLERDKRDLINICRKFHDEVLSLE